MKKFLIILLLGLLVLPVFVLAAEVNPEKSTIDQALKNVSDFETDSALIETDEDPESTITEVVGDLIYSFLGFLGAASLVIFIYGGIMWMLSEGNDTQIAKAQKTMIWAAIGLFAVFVSSAVLRYVFGAFYTNFSTFIKQ